MLDSALALPDESLSFCNSFPAEAVMRARLSCPAPGRSLGATVTRVERPLREAVRLLGRAIVVDHDAFASVFDCTVYGPEAVRESDDARLAWLLVSVALAHAFLTRRGNVAPFLPAMEWFFGEARLPRRLLACFLEQQIRAAENELSSLNASADLLDLLPYVIEPHGHVTRNRLETCHVAKKTRDVKKDTGVYYTPSDIADFMVGSLAAFSGARGTWLDPACGTGVFMRAVLAFCRKNAPNLVGCDLGKFAISNVFGIDKSALATDLAAIILLIECALATPQGDPLFGLWQQLKGNIVCMDALRLVPRRATADLHRDPTALAEIEEAFPRVGCRGFDHVVMNPPYAMGRVDESLEAIWHSYTGMSTGQSADTHLAFTEMLWRLTSEGGASAAVLPLSVGTNTTKSYARLRDELLKSSGTKEFLFFDREPQALFGEDIKTRNLVLFRHGVSNKTSVRTSRLLKWTAEQRPSIFTRDRLVTIDVPKCGSFIPKFATETEAISYSKLTSQGALLRAAPFVPRIGKVTLDGALAADSPINGRTLLVSSTAYNFINCFFVDGLPSSPPRPYSSSPLASLLFGSENDAYAAFALISSRLCFWLWHVEGDGFHLTNDFLRRLSLWSVFGCEALKVRLSAYGRLLWRTARGAAVGTVNGGKQTYSFYCGHDHPIAIETEHALLQHLRLSGAFSRSIGDFVQATVSIDGKCRMRRSHSE